MAAQQVQESCGSPAPCRLPNYAYTSQPRVEAMDAMVPTSMLTTPTSSKSGNPSKAETKVINFVSTRVELLSLLSKSKNSQQMVQASADAFKTVAASLQGVPTISVVCAIELLNMIESPLSLQTTCRE